MWNPNRGSPLNSSIEDVTDSNLDPKLTIGSRFSGQAQDAWDLKSVSPVQ